MLGVHCIHSLTLNLTLALTLTLTMQAAAKEPFGVTLGAIIGHAICTGIAVVGGKLLASRISERMTLMAGGALFILFAIAALIQGPASY